MKAMILAAGLGQRMRPLTDRLPKPLLKVNEKTLLDYHLEKIQAAGIKQVIINLAYLGEKIREHLADNPYPDLSIIFSQEPEPLETGGAILHAAKFLGEDDFLLINGDVWSDLNYQEFINYRPKENSRGHLLMVPNPEFHHEGDFQLNLSTQKLALKENQSATTFAGISILSPPLILNYPQKRTKFPLAEVLRSAIAREELTGELFQGHWSDVGTPQRLQQLNEYLRKLDS